MEFEKRKKATLSTMNSPEPDKSPKGNIDTPIIPLLNTLNSHPSFFTTSSCSGRISILSQPTTAAATAAKKKAKGGRWVFITHDPAEPDSVLNLLFPTTESTRPESSHLSGSLVFRFEPLIIAVECKDVVSAQKLVSLAISCGFRESGVTSVNKRVIVAIRCSIRLEVPLGDSHKLMVSKEYVHYLVEIANGKMEANRRRTDNFLEVLLKNGFQESGMNEALDNKDASMSVEVQKSGFLSNVKSNDGEEDNNLKKSNKDDTDCGSLGFHEIGLHINQILINEEPIERLYIWGHSACTMGIKKPEKVLIFGGFGGMGTHARKNDSLLLDIISGKLESVDFPSTPSPCLGHTASLVGDLMFVIGGRADPMNILSDVWALNTAKNEWRPLQCTGCVFPPSHRHAAAVVGSKIYVFGGIQNGIISSSLYVLDPYNLVWDEIHVQGGEPPCPCHSHSLVAYGSQLFMFGGHDGEKALADLYSFNVQTCLWKKEKMAGRAPYARFSHMMFVYRNYIGVIGGCPIRQHCQELSLLDLQSHSWKHVKMNSIGQDLFVRSTASVVGDDLVIIGGGAACYAFGTKFSAPMKMNLLPLISLAYSSMLIGNGEEKIGTRNRSLESLLSGSEEISSGDPSLNLEIEGLGINARHQTVPLHLILQLERKHAKAGKDILKKFGWLDLGRKVYSHEYGLNVCFPVTAEFFAVYQNKQSDLNLLQPISGGFFLLKDISNSVALNLLAGYGATIHVDKVVKVKKSPHSPLKAMNDAVASLLSEWNLPSELLEQLPTRWERIGDVVVLPVTSFKDPVWDSFGKILWVTVAESLGTCRLARQGRISPTGTRDSTLEILVGDNGWIDHRENGILYSFDATKCMFSWGNLSEKLRMARLDCTNEVIVDMFAGIGYFVLPFLVRANAKLVYACEWNPHAVEALRCNLHANGVADRCIILEGDNRVNAPKGVADRVSLGLLPSSEGSWVTAVRALRSEGGMLHVHGNVKDSEEGLWTEQVLKSISKISRSEGYRWEISVEHVERVKWYAPHIRHLVADVRCKLLD